MAVYSSVRDLGITGGNIFTVMSTTVTIFARATMAVSPRGVSARQNAAGSFTAKPGMTRMDMKPLANTGKPQVLRV